MHNTKERLSLLWIFAILNYLYADVLALFAMACSLPSPKVPPALELGNIFPALLLRTWTIVIRQSRISNQ